MMSMVKKMMLLTMKKKRKRKKITTMRPKVTSDAKVVKIMRMHRMGLKRLGRRRSFFSPEKKKHQVVYQRDWEHG